MTNLETYKTNNKYLVGRKESAGFVIEARTEYSSQMRREHDDLNVKKNKGTLK